MIYMHFLRFGFGIHKNFCGRGLYLYAAAATRKLRETPHHHRHFTSYLTILKSKRRLIALT